MSLSFVRLPGCGKGSCYLLTQMKDDAKDGFNLTLTDGEKIWDGQLTEEDLNALSGNLKMDFDTYVMQTAKAFRRQDMAAINFAYQVKPQADGIVDLVWKKEVSGDIKIKMGSVTLHLKKNAAEALCEIFTSCIDMTMELQTKIRSLESDNQRLSQERQNALKRLDKCVSAKEDLEKDLYSKFVAVLNSKKEKIRNMQNGHDADGESVEVEPTASTSETAPTKKRGRAKGKEVAENSDDSTGEDKQMMTQSSEDARDTDEETPPKKARGPTRTAGKDADTSLRLSDDDADDDNSHKGKGVVRRPARQRGGNNKRQTPSKPVLPKVSSRSSDVGAKTPVRSSMRKSGSGQSERSVDKLDPDDLLNDF